MAKFSLFALATWVGLAAAKDVYLNWHIGWVNASPDGFERPVIGINGQWPCPQIDVNVGDQLIVDVYNGLGNESTAIHWHGMRQQGSGVMDGAVGVTQCPIAPGSHMQYHFDVNQAGTYWYHSHNMGQYPDGLRGALIVHDPSPPFHYDDEFTITLSDWYHKEMPELLDAASVASHGQEPLPDSALINDSTNTKIKVLPNKTYLVHIICIGNWPGHFWVLDGHEMTVVEVDGVYTEPHPAGDKFLRVATGQRMGVLIKTKPDASQNFAIWDTMDVNMMFIFENRTIPEGYNPNATAWLVYDEAKPLPEPPVFQHIDFQTDFVDDVTLVPADHEPLLQPVNQQIILETGVGLVDGVPRFTVNGKTYISPKVPSLYTANTIGAEFSSNPEVYGQVNPFVVKHNDVVEIVINNHHNNLHPWHLHGHQFQVLQRTPVDGGYYNGLTSNVSATPIRRDTIMVQNNGHAVIRFRADNPGVWMLHCHIEWHVEAGLMATIIEAPETFATTVHAPPKSHYDTCAAYPQDISGNAAGNDGLDLTGLDTKAEAGSHGALYTPTKGAKRPAAAHPSQQSTQAPVANPPAPKAQPQAPQPALPNNNHEQPSTQAPVANPPAPKAQPQAPQPALPNNNHEQPSTQAPVENPPAPKAQPQAPQPALPNYNHEQPSAAPRPTADPANVDAGNTNDYCSAPHTAETHDHHVTIHEESTKGPLPNQNTHSGYVIDNGHNYPIKDASYGDILDGLEEDWE